MGILATGILTTTGINMTPTRSSVIMASSIQMNKTDYDGASCPPQLPRYIIGLSNRAVTPFVAFHIAASEKTPNHFSTARIEKHISSDYRTISGFRQELHDPSKGRFQNVFRLDATAKPSHHLVVAITSGVDFTGI
jgi:hypothetical protein